ncbi:MAG TPA: protein phosphatase 2C domain-containing protein [Ktedonobacteraceae bacterium]|nr:protein phosphatase 2C domain-containing protein [Ktedonobacteraceae bacterium]
MLPKTRPISYPGELPDISHSTISLRAQLRLSYETYAWLRYLCGAGLLLPGVLLFLLPGSFPPHVFILLWQTLPVAGHLLALHGWAAFFSLLALLAQALTWLVLWGLYALVCRSFVRYTWRFYRSQSFLASGWLPSTSLRVDREPRGELVAASLSQAAPGASLGRPVQTIGFAAPAAPRGQVAPGVMNASSAGYTAQMKRPAVPQGQTAPGKVPTTPQGQNYGSPSGITQVTAAIPGRPVREVASVSSTRQFVQPPTPSVRTHTTAAASEPATSALRTDWPSIALASGPGVAWDVGLARKHRPNEDSVLTMRGACNFAERLLPFELHIIADGMGGHAQGRLASHLAIRSMLETVVPGLIASNTLEGEQIVDILIDGAHWANQVIYQYGQEHHADMGTTITAVLVLGDVAYIINVGDSRTYIYRPNVGLHQVTRDHSLVARLVETGAIAPEDIYTHPDRNKVYRGLGDKTDVTVDWFILPVQVGDILLLCSDGLWEMVRDQRISELLATYASTPALASNALLRAALQAGGSDNVSLLVVRIQP